MTIPTTAQIVAVALDSERLSDLVGDAIKACRLRIKPGHSVTVAVHDQTRDLPAWLRFIWPSHLHHAERIRRQARAYQLPIFECPFGSSIMVQGGWVNSDPALIEVIRDAHLAGLLGEITAKNLLRYNPARRIVARNADQVVRVSKASMPERDQVETFLNGQLPIPERLDSGFDEHIRVHAWVDGSDLRGGHDHTATRLAGGLFARLHSQTARLPRSLATRLQRRMVDAASQCQANAGVLDALAPDLASRIRRLAACRLDLGEGQVLCHGDASPDQVLYQAGQQRAWLTDFDRVHLGPIAVDLGSYLATVGSDHVDALLKGYQEGGGVLPEPDSVLAAQYRSMLLRIAEPLRSADPDWRSEIDRRLNLLEGEIQCVLSN